MKLSEQKKSHANETDLMLSEIRNLLLHDIKDEGQHPRRSKSVEDSEIQKYLTESFALAQSEGGNLDKGKDIELMHSKISEASELLEKQMPMIKMYVKQKIQSNFFANKIKKDSPEKDLSNWHTDLLHRRDQLEKKRLQERVEEEQRKKNILDATRKLRGNYPVKEVPLFEVQSIIEREGEDFDSLQKQDQIVSSKKSQVLKVGGIDFGKFSEPKVRNPKFKQIKGKKIGLGNSPLQIQIIGEDEDESKYVKSQDKKFAQRLRNTLRLNPKFFNCFSKFIESIAEKQKSEKIDLAIEKAQTKKKKFMYPNQLAPFGKRKQNVTMSELSKKFQTRPIVFYPAETSLLGHNHDQKEVKRVISKRIGETGKFHNKQSILKGNVLYYSEEADNSDLKSMKKIAITMQPVTFDKILKDQSSVFFIKNESQTQIACLKGRERNLYFEYDSVEGKELIEDINRINLRAFHVMSCMLSGRTNQNMEKFIFGGDEAPYNSEKESYIFDLSDSYIRSVAEYSEKSHRENFLQLLNSLFPKRKNIRQLLLRNSQLGFPELLKILQNCELHCDSITDIDLSQNKVNTEILGHVFKISKNSTGNSLRINLAESQISDDIFLPNIIHLSNVSSKISEMDLSRNELTDKGISALSGCLASKICGIKVLDISSCKVGSLASIIEMVRSSHKLEVLKANFCELNMNDEKSLSDLLQACQKPEQSVRIKKIELKNQKKLKSLSLMGEMMNEKLQISVTVDAARKSIQSKYLTVELI